MSIPAVLRVLFRVIRKPFKAFSRKARPFPPSVYLNPALGKHECASVNGIQLYYVAAGSPDKPLMLFLHGWPECWYSWRYQLKYEQFREKYRVVAVDLRGFGRSSKPSYFPGAYHRETIAEDIHLFIRALGYDSCVLVGHDWGSNIAFTVARHYPESVSRLIAMNVPEDRIFQSFCRANPSQLVSSLYMAFFQVPFLPEFLLSLFDYGFITSAFTKPPGGLINKDRISADDLEVYKWNVGMHRTLTSSLNYYRNIPAMLAPITLGQRKPTRRYAMPTLVLWGESDSAVDSRMAKEHEECTFFDDVMARVIPSASHWLPQDQPDVVNQLMLTWLTSKEGK